MFGAHVWRTPAVAPSNEIQGAPNGLDAGYCGDMHIYDLGGEKDRFAKSDLNATPFFWHLYGVTS